MIANAPTARASVDTPTSDVSSPQTTNSTPRKSSCDGNADFDAHRRRFGRRHAEAQARAVDNAARHVHLHRVAMERLARPVAVGARFRPRFAAAAAVRAGGTDRHVDGYDQSPRGFELRQRYFGAQHVGVGGLAEKT